MIKIFVVVLDGKTRDNHYWEFSLDVKGNFFFRRVIQQWKRRFGEFMKFPFSEILKTWPDKIKAWPVKAWSVITDLALVIACSKGLQKFGLEMSSCTIQPTFLQFHNSGDTGKVNSICKESRRSRPGIFGREDRRSIPAPLWLSNFLIGSCENPTHWVCRIMVRFSN